MPPGGWVKYIDPDTKEVIGHPYLKNVRAFARGHRLKRGLPIPVDWDQKFSEVICEHNPQMCAEIPTLTEKASQLGRSLIKWAMSGFKVVSEDGYNARLAVCSGDPEKGLPVCEWFKGVRGVGRIACGKCGCSRVKFYLATEKCPLNKW